MGVTSHMEVREDERNRQARVSRMSRASAYSRLVCWRPQRGDLISRKELTRFGLSYPSDNKPVRGRGDGTTPARRVKTTGGTLVLIRRSI